MLFDRKRARRNWLFVLLGAFLVISVWGFILAFAGLVRAEEREFTLRVNQADLQFLDRMINEVPIPRKETQPFLNRMQSQIIEQMKPQSPAPDAQPKGTEVPPK